MRPLALVLVLSAGCAQTVNVKVPGPHTRVIVDGNDLGDVGPSGETIELKPGLDPVPYVIKHPDNPDEIGEVARTEPLWWIVAAGVAGAVCCAPAFAGAGFCIANPGVIGAPLAFALSGDVGSLTASFVAPSWFTLPLVATCGAAGLAPLGAAFIAETVPPEIVLPVRESGPAPAMAH